MMSSIYVWFCIMYVFSYFGFIFIVCPCLIARVICWLIDLFERNKKQYELSRSLYGY